MSAAEIGASETADDVESHGYEAAARENFALSFGQFYKMIGFLSGPEAAAMEHGELEARLVVETRELCRRACQEHLKT